MDSGSPFRGFISGVRVGRRRRRAFFRKGGHLPTMRQGRAWRWRHRGLPGGSGSTVRAEKDPARSRSTARQSPGSRQSQASTVRQAEESRPRPRSGSGRHASAPENSRGNRQSLERVTVYRRQGATRRGRGPANRSERSKIDAAKKPFYKATEFEARPDTRKRRPSPSLFRGVSFYKVDDAPLEGNGNGVRPVVGRQLG